MRTVVNEALKKARRAAEEAAVAYLESIGGRPGPLGREPEQLTEEQDALRTAAVAGIEVAWKLKRNYARRMLVIYLRSPERDLGWAWDVLQIALGIEDACDAGEF
jgi:hypothetical protein